MGRQGALDFFAMRLNCSGSSKWENDGEPPCSVRQYLNEDYKDWPGDWEGDFDYVDGKLQWHDWGDLAHGEMHERLIGHFSQQREKSNIRVLPSFTLEITPTRFRVPDVVIFGGDVPHKEITKASVPLLVIEVLSPEDTLMHGADLVSDYLAKGVAHIWIVDPRTHSGWDCGQGNWVRTEEFEIPGLPITVKLADLRE
jgi:Uma2 family endonuclease